MNPRYNIDVFASRNGRCFGWGWFLDETSPAKECTLILKLRDGCDQRIPCFFSGMRADLQAAYPHVVHAASAGFMVQSYLNGEIEPGAPGRLEVALADGRREVWEVSAAALSSGSKTSVSKREKVLAVLTRLRKDFREAGAFRVVARSMRKAADRWKSRPHALRRRLHAMRRDRTALVFDHDMGGGANRYRQDLVKRLTESGRNAVVIVPKLASLDYSIAIHAPGRPPAEFRAARTEPVLAAIGAFPALEIHVNELVSFDDPLAIMDWCVSVRGKSATHLTFHLHDYYAACPSWTLVADDGRFCGVPSLERCRACLPRNAVNTMGFTRETDLVRWRAGWGTFLARCDRIVAFSRASIDILRLAHPGFPEERVEVSPHRIDASMLRAVIPCQDGPVVVAVAGHISRPKGADMLREMARVIQRRSLAIRIVVLGTLEGHSQSDAISVSGSFQSGELPGLLERERASICFLPSVCAETFSFVTDEYMAMRMPVAVFPIGAPAERVSGYADGLVISRIDADAAVTEILDFVLRRRSRCSQ